MANSPAPEVEPAPAPGMLLPADRFIVLYDGGCGICRAWIARMQKLDTSNNTAPVPISPEALAGIEPRLSFDDCMRELHVVTPERRVYAGWDAVARIARLFPLTWLVGAFGALPGLRHLGRLFYRYIAAHRHAISQCRT